MIKLSEQRLINGEALEEMWLRLNKLIKPNRAIVLFGSEPFSSALRMSNIKNYKYDVVWNKNKCGSPGLAKKRFMKMHENISIFCDGVELYNPQMEIGEPYSRKRSGSTGVACRNTNRNFIGIELNEEYYEIAKDRIKGLE